MATVKLFLDKRRKDPNLIDPVTKSDKNKYPLRIRIFLGEERADLTLIYKFSTNEWIESENRVAKSYPNCSRVNSSIQKRFSIANTVLMDYETRIKDVSIKVVKRLIEEEIKVQLTPPSSDIQVERIEGELINEASSSSLKKYGQKLIDRTNLKGEFSTARWYNDGIKAIIKFNNGLDISFNDIDISFLEDFQAHHISKSNSKNTISAYLRAIRAVTNYAIKEIFEGKRYKGYPWGDDGFTIPSVKTKKRAIDRSVIDKLRLLELKSGGALWNAQNYFLFMFNNRGINFMDIAKLRRSQIVQAIVENDQLIEGRIEYLRSKTDKLFSMKLTKEAIKILNSYEIAKKMPKDFIFPICFENTLKGWKVYQKKLSRNNSRFKKLAEMAGEPNLNITSYVARHSWASIAKKSGISPAIIGEGLGHSDFKVTEMYLEEFETNILDEANDLIVS
jgi:integrase/recombinase XerD